MDLLTAFLRQSQYIGQAVLKLAILLTQLLKCWDKHVSLHSSLTVTSEWINKYKEYKKFLKFRCVKIDVISLLPWESGLVEPISTDE